MAAKTKYLGLLLPALGEFFNRWNVPINRNSEIVDQAVGELQEEVLAARGSQTDLQSRLNNSLNPDGTLKPTPELLEARSSRVYGNGPGGAGFSLPGRLEQLDREVWDARQQQASLLGGLAWGDDSHKPNTIVSAPTSFLTYTGGTVTVNGDATPVVANINGYRQVVRTKKSVGIAGAAGTYYLYLEKQEAGDPFLSGIQNGSVSSYDPTGLLSRFRVSSGVNFVTSDVRPGDVLEVYAPAGNDNVGQYIVAATNRESPDDLTTSDLLIIGKFPTESSGLSWRVVDPVAPRLGFTAAAHSKVFKREAGRIYIGRCVFDGTNITDVMSYALNGEYTTFRPVTADFDETVAHRIGYIPKAIRIYASQAADFSAPLEPLSFGDIAATTTTTTTTGTTTAAAAATTLTNVQPLDPAAPATAATSVTPTSTSTSTSTSTTTATPSHGVQVQLTDMDLRVKNAARGLFYRDFQGTPRISGYLYIVIER